MLFNSVNFLIFFPIVVFIYFLIPKKVKLFWLLVCSYYFYMCWNAKYAVLIGFSTVITFLAGILIDKVKNKNNKRIIVFTSLFINLGLLFFFKYFDFAILNINRILNLFHINNISNPYSFVLPVGISFYIFQALGYTIDVYRGEIPPEKNIFKYALFVSFFPQLVAGPIERSKNLLTQIDSLKDGTSLKYERIVKGFALMVFGLFMKMVIADRAALFVDTVFGNIYACGSVECFLAAVLFAIEIYCDFGGYSNIAIGSAYILGFDLCENFNAPYLATSIKDFWRRWHISLSMWFRDYLYIPLGGNRLGKARKYLNLLITFLISGLWHGAAWSYVIWGGIHAVYQIVGDVSKPVRNWINKLLNVNKGVFSYKLGQILITDLCVCFAWIFFRAKSLKEALIFVKRMVSYFDPWVLFDESIYNWGINSSEMVILILAILILLLVDLIRELRGINVGEFLYRQNTWFRWAVLIILIISILVYGEYGIDFDGKQFIYFQF